MTGDNTLTALINSIRQQGEQTGHGQWVGPELDDIQATLQRRQPEVLLYGTYNAGKSTLVNALVGRHQAATADAPCTTAVAEIQRGEYLLIDTPGIDAPVEHEQISRDRLCKVDSVVFVLSAAGQFDETKTIDELAALLAAKVPVIAVFNHKSGGGDAVVGTLVSKELKLAMLKLRENLGKRVGAERAAALEVLLVNAKTAWTGVEKAKPELVAASGLHVLERAIRRHVLRAQQTGPELPALRNLRDLVANMGERVGERVASPAVAFQDEVHNRAIGERAEVLRDVEHEGNRLSARCHLRFAGALKKEEAARQEALRQAAEDEIGEFEQQLDKALRAAELRLGQGLAEIEARWSASTPQVAVAAESPRADLTRPAAAPFKVDMTKAATWANSPAGVKQIEKGLLALKKMKVPVFKGQSGKLLGKWAGRIGKGVGVGLPVAVAAWQWWQANKEHTKQVERANDAEGQLDEAARGAAQDFARTATAEARSLVLETFAPLLAELEESRRAAAVEDGAQAAAQLALSSLARRIAIRLADLELIVAPSGV